MDHAALVRAVEEEGDRLVLALSEVPMDAMVPTCEGWKVSDLCTHVGDFCGFWSHVLCEGSGRPKTPFRDAPDGEALVMWLAELADHLVAELKATPASTAVWTWYPHDQTAGFVARRCAHELAVHRTDAQAARGDHMPIAAELAVDGVDEVLDVLLSIREHHGAGTGRTLALVSSDTGTAWRIHLGSERIGVERPRPDAPELASSNLTVTGTASDIELVLYQRPTLSPVDMVGDLTVLDEWHRDFTF